MITGSCIFTSGATTVAIFPAALRKNLHFIASSLSLKGIVELDEVYVTAGLKDNSVPNRRSRIRRLKHRRRNTYTTNKPLIPNTQPIQLLQQAPPRQKAKNTDDARIKNGKIIIGKNTKIKCNKQIIPSEGVQNMCVWDVFKIKNDDWKIRGWIVFDERWGAKNFGPVVHLNPIENPVARAKQSMEISVDRRKKIKERFPYLHIENSDPQPKPPSSVLGYGWLVFCIVYGAPRPRWDEKNGVWWHDRENVAWDWVKTVKDVESIKVPRWEDEPEVKAMFKQREVLKRAFPGQKIKIGAMVGKDYEKNLLHYPNFIDISPHLLGNTRHFRILASDPELAHALMDKCFEISTSYSEFLMRVDDVDIKDVDGLSTLGGDYSSTLSPKLYAEYSNGWNRRVLNHFKEIANRSGDPPCSIHSCGPSTHLYEEFSKIPNVIGIETRGVVSGIEKLRKALPKAHLNIAFAPPHVNFETISPEELRNVMWKFVEGAGSRDISLHAWCPTETPDENVRAYYKTLQEINNSV